MYDFIGLVVNRLPYAPTSSTVTDLLRVIIIAQKLSLAFKCPAQT
jgi:hypothetical protein